MRVVTDDEKIVIGNNRNAWSARQLQRSLASTVEELVFAPQLPRG
jgi:hypothetical protein